MRQIYFNLNKLYIYEINKLIPIYILKDDNWKKMIIIVNKFYLILIIIIFIY